MVNKMRVRDVIRFNISNPQKIRKVINLFTNKESLSYIFYYFNNYDIEVLLA